MGDSVFSSVVHTVGDIWGGIVEPIHGTAEALMHGTHGHAAHLLHGAGKALGPLSMLVGGAEIANAVMNEEGADAPIGVLRGASSLTAGVATTAGSFGLGGAAVTKAAAVAGPLAAAAAGGLLVGQKLAHHLDGNTQQGVWGKDEWGNDRDVFDVAADWGNGVENGIQDFFGVKEDDPNNGFWGSLVDGGAGVLGGITAGLGSAILGVCGAAPIAAIHGIEGLFGFKPKPFGEPISVPVDMSKVPSYDNIPAAAAKPKPFNENAAKEQAEAAWGKMLDDYLAKKGPPPPSKAGYMERYVTDVALGEKDPTARAAATPF
jgi:hypothetical protein